MLCVPAYKKGPFQTGRRPGSCVEESQIVTPLDAETNLRQLLRRH